MEHPTTERRTRDRLVLRSSFLALLAFAAFFLVRPFLDAAPAYRPRPAGTTYGYSLLVVAAFAPYAAALSVARRGLDARWAFAGAMALHLVLAPAALTQSQDPYAYLLYGKMAAVHGLNPYVALPTAVSTDPWFAYMRWPDLQSVYGPGWTLVSAGIARLSPASIGLGLAMLKILATALSLAAVAGVAVAARDRGLDRGAAVLAVGWNPLVLTALPLGAHTDAALAAAGVWALVADRRGRVVTAALLLTVAALVKVYAVLLLGGYLVTLVVRRRRRAALAAAAAAATSILAYAPFWAGLETFRGLLRAGAERSTSLAGTVEEILQRALRALGTATGPAATIAQVTVRAVAAAAIAVMAVRVIRAAASRDDPWRAMAVLVVTYFLVSPWYVWWYLTGILPVLVVVASDRVRMAALTFSATSMLTVSGGTFPGRIAQAVVRYGPPALVAGRGTGTPGARLDPPGAG